MSSINCLIENFYNITSCIKNKFMSHKINNFQLVQKLTCV